MTASARPSKIAASLSRSEVSTPKLSLSAARIESSDLARSPISSRPETSSGTSKRPEAICSAARARRLTRWAIAVATSDPAMMPITTAIPRARRVSSPIRSVAPESTPALE